MREIFVGRGKSDPIQEIASVNHSGNLRDAIKECFDPEDQYLFTNSEVRVHMLEEDCKLAQMIRMVIR